MALKEWNSLYTDSVELIWQNERVELKRAAMLLHVLGLEFAKIKSQAESELSQYRAKYIQIDNCNATNITKKSPPEKFNFKTPILTKLKNPPSEIITGFTPLNISTNSNIIVNSKVPYVSPDLFRFSSPESTSKLDENINDQDISTDDDIVLTQSPKIKKNPKVLKMRRNNDASILQCKKSLIRNNCLEIISSPICKLKTNSKLMIKKFEKNNEMSPANVCIDESMIVATPEPVNRNKSKLVQRSIIGSKSKLQKTKLFNNSTLTQMFPPVTKMDDSDATVVCDLPEESMKVEDILGMLDKEKEKENCDDDFMDYIKNYDNVPEKKIEPVEKLCKLCTKLGKKCARHRTAPLTQEHRTFTGFWDLDFSVDELNSETEDSTVF